MEPMGGKTKGTEKSRPTWTEYFMAMAYHISTRSTCLSRQVGAVIVKDRRILSTGYNGVPRGIQHCGELGCLRKKLKIPTGERYDICRAIHAEQNAIIQAAVHGVSIDGSVMYCNVFPCMACARIIVNSGIKQIMYDEVWKGVDDVWDLLMAGDVESFSYKTRD